MALLQPRFACWIPQSSQAAVCTSALSGCQLVPTLLCVWQPLFLVGADCLLQRPNSRCSIGHHLLDSDIAAPANIGLQSSCQAVDRAVLKQGCVSDLIVCRTMCRTCKSGSLVGLRTPAPAVEACIQRTVLGHGPAWSQTPLCSRCSCGRLL